MGLARKVAVIGAGMTQFHHRLHIDKTSRDLFVEAALEALDSVDSGMNPKDIEALYVGNFSSDAFEHQGHLGSLMADWLGVIPIPAVRIEDACASSGVAIQLGILAVASGAFDMVMVGGVEKMRTLSTEEVTDALATASDEIYEASVGMTFPGLYASMATAHFAKYVSSWEDLAAISIKNHHNGSLNPKAQFQEEIMDTARRRGPREGYDFKDEMDFLRSPLNPLVAYPLRL
ncbi:MAG: beta-ketoacyl synthase N-terminal-like domain-containing protein, partial [Candidatus Bathyarchaeia archaeon]